MDRARTDLLLLGSNAIDPTIPVRLHLQPSLEPSMARAAVVVFFAGPALAAHPDPPQ